MDKRERLDDPVEALRVAIEGSLADVWTALPGIVQSFDADAKTVTVQPAIKGRVEQPDGQIQSVALPLLVDVPVVFPCGGGFALTFPVAKGDEALVVFASRCIDSWWQSGGIGEPLEPRSHDLSDGFAFVGPFSQANALTGGDTSNVQLRTVDGSASVTMMPDYTIKAHNPAVSLELLANGAIIAAAKTSIMLSAPLVTIAAGSFALTGPGGGPGSATMAADLDITGSVKVRGDVTAGGVSLQKHTHSGVTPGSGQSGGPA